MESNVSYVASEMMFGLREQFLYFQCSKCGCLQIAQIPEVMNPYYPSGSYYSYQLPIPQNAFKTKFATTIRRVLLRFYLGKGRKLIRRIVKFLFHNKEYQWITQIPGLKLSSNILDIGSGTGLLLLDLHRLGFTSLTGIDPFIDNDLYFAGGIKIFKKDIYGMDKQFDLIMLNHTFEHLENPHEIFDQFNKKLTSGGFLVIRIPVVDSFSWRKYGVSWFQLDAPRHFFLHSVKSMAILAKNHGFNFVSIKYDSNENQFYNSEKYLRDKSLFEYTYVEPRVLNKWRKLASNLNHINDGDQACFIFSKNN